MIPMTNSRRLTALALRPIRALVAGLDSRFLLALVILSAGQYASAAASPLRVLPPGQVPADERLQPPKDLDGYFPFAPASTLEEWTRRSDQVRKQIRVSLGLWPAPTRTPLHSVIHGKVDRDDYTVEKVFFESVPGFFVTGNLYRPKNKAGPLPGVLCPHGHWENGRFMDYGPDRVRQEIAQGAERFEEGGRSVLQARCVQLARMGCVVFHYDMIGYADSQQLSFDLAHRFSRQRPEMNSVDGWGLFSPQAEAHLQSIMGLQTWNSIRALDFLLELSEVDPQRIGVTGASGGGTQTFLLCAVDPRPTLAFPAVMVSTAMQGGCTCENACLLRVETGNVEFAGLFAPKPLGMTAADDWTREMSTKGFPELKRLYQMLGASENAMLKPLIHFEHNYNHVSRVALYGWVNRHFKLGWREPVLERDYQRLSREEMSVWDNQHPQPPGGPDFERKLLAWLSEDAKKQLEPALQSVEAYRQTVGGAVDVLIGRNLADVGEIVMEEKARREANGYTRTVGLLRHRPRSAREAAPADRGREELPVVLLQPANPRGGTVIWADDTGKAGLFEASASHESPEPKPAIRHLLEAGISVVGVDLLYQGEFLTNSQPFTRTPRVQNPREAAAYTFGYNRALFAQRVHDLLTVIKFAAQQQPKPRRIELVGLDGTGPLVAAALAQAKGAVAGAAINTGGFRFAKVTEVHDPNFLPGGAKYGDLPGLLALAAPAQLWLAGEPETAVRQVSAMYAMSGSSRSVVVSAETNPERITPSAVDWLLAKRAEKSP